MSDQTKPVILYFYTQSRTFVSRDIELLREKYDVKGCGFYHSSKLYTPLLLLKQLFFILRHIFKAQASLCMFAGYHSFFPSLVSKWLNKPFVIILGGTDSVVIPSLNYGILRKNLIGTFARWSYRLTKHFAPVHESLIFYENTYDESLSKYQGIKSHIPEINAEFTIIHNGFDSKKFYNLNQKRIPNSFLTVAFDLHKTHLFQLKGADLIIKIAPQFPNCTFTIVGLKELKDCPTNVVLKPVVTQNELLELYNNHEFYFQLSVTEGFPNALCEAMLCGCIPIVSNVSSMPEIVGDTGFILSRRDAKGLKNLLHDILSSLNKEMLGSKARSKIVNDYSLKARKDKLYQLLEGLYTSNT